VKVKGHMIDMFDNLETLQFERVGKVAIVRLARPPVNAVNRQMMSELRRCFDALAEDRDVGAVVLSAQGDRAFCGGIDLKELATPPDPSALPVRDVLDTGVTWRDTQHAIRHCPVPVIAAVEGPAIGAGFGLVGVVDIIIASARASFGLTEINVGLLGGSSKALRMIGPYKARMMFFMGDLVGADEFYRLGAIEEIVNNGDAEARAIAIGQRFGEKSPIALRLAKESILRIEDLPMEEAYRLEQDYTTRLRGYRDAGEAMRAQLEKRPANWSWS
jgi:enoyl-CoA hydratase